MLHTADGACLLIGISEGARRALSRSLIAVEFTLTLFSANYYLWLGLPMHKSAATDDVLSGPRGIVLLNA